MDISRLFNEPYFSALATLPGGSSPSVIGIAGLPFLIDTSDYTISSQYRFQQESFDVVQQRNTADSRDLLLLPQDVWRQQVQSWHLGAGQSNMDRDSTLPYRYEASFGIDPWTQWEINLLPSTLKLGTYAGKTWLTRCGSYLVVVNGQSAYWYTDTVSAPVVLTPLAGHAIIDIADTSPVVTVLLDNGAVYTMDNPLGPATLAIGTHTTATMIAYEKDFLLMGDTNRIYNITGATNTLVYTHPIASFRWIAACSGDSCIYALGGVGDKWVIHRIGINADGTSLAPAIVAATLPDGEVGYGISSYLGRIFIGTSKGVRVAIAGSNGDLTLGPIIPTTQPVYCFEGQDRFVWYGMSSMACAYGAAEPGLFPDGPTVGLGRMDLSVATTTALTPAYASDICALDQVANAANPVRSIVTWNGIRAFSIDNVGVYIETSTPMAAGWLQQGIMSFSVADTKTGLYTMAKMLPLVGEIDLDLSYDSTDFARVSEITIAGSVTSTNISLNGAQFSRFNARYVLKRSATNASPRMTRWELRAIPVKGRASRWTIPVMNHAVVDIDGVTYNRDPLVVKNSFITLAEHGILFTLQESGQTYLVHIKSFTWVPQRLAEGGKAWEGVFVLVVEEVQ